MIDIQNYKKIACACFFVGASWGAFNQAHAETLKLAIDTASENSPAGRSLTYWGDKIEEHSGGELEVDIFYQNQLGSQQEVYDLLMAGSIDGMLTWPMTAYDKRIGVIYTPYMLTDWSDALDAYSPDGWLFNLVDGIMDENGLKFLGPWPEGFNGIATTGQCVTEVANKESVKLRTIPVYPFPQSIQAMGYQTASIDWSELYTALQTGVVDGDAGNVIYHDYEYFRDILDCYVRTKHMFMTAMYIMNNNSFDRLSEKHKSAVLKASNDAVKKQFEDGEKVDAEYVEKAKEAGMTYVELPSEGLNERAQKVRASVWPQMGNEIGEDLVEIIKNNADEF